MKTSTLLLFLGILVIGLLLRINNFNSPIADWHSWRQVDTSSVSRVFVQEGFDVLRPRYHDLSNVPSGFENPNGYRLVEFPLYNIFQAGLHKTVPFVALEQWGRIVTIIASLLSITFIFLLVRRYTEDKVALASSFLFAILPFSIYYGRVILPDPSMTAAILGGIYFFDLWVENHKSRSRNKHYRSILLFIATLLFTVSALLLKPFALFFILPFIAIAFNNYRFSMFKKWQLWLFAFLAIVPIVLWRLWITNFPEGIPVSDWLFNGGEIRFKGAFFNWIFANRISGLILGFWGSIFLVIGILLNSNSEKLFNYKKGQMLLFWSFLISSLSYLVIMARGNVQHDYYQILIIPTIVIFSGLGIKIFMDPPNQLFKKYISYPVLIVILLFTFAFSWFGVRDYFNINRSSIIIAGNAVDKLTPKDSLIIANYEGDTTFLYQTNRKGWASYTHELSEMIDMGAEYLVISDPNPSDLEFGNKYEVIESKPEYIIFKLN